MQERPYGHELIADPVEWWEELRASFPLCERRAYFFAGAQAPIAREVRHAIEGFLDLWEDRAWRVELTEWSQFDEAAELLGQVFECDPTRVIATEGTSHSMNIATSMVLAKWRADGERQANVVLHRESHPASSLAWLNAKRLGAPLDLRWPAPESGENDVDTLARAVDDETIAVVLTHVSHLTGTRLDVNDFASRFPTRSFALLLDAAQSAGAIPLKVESDLLDFIGLPAYKWLFGPPGVGLLIAQSSWIEEVGPPSVGWASAADVWAMDAQDLILASGGAGFRLGIPNFQGMAGARAGLALSRDAGHERIADRIHSLTDLLLTGITESGYSTPTPLEWQRRAGVVCVEVNDVTQTVDLLLREGIEVGYEVDYLRVDPHAYNTEEEILELVERLPKVAPPPT
jgi:selenocysteine lyase/cysteine desulfurase